MSSKQFSALVAGGADYVQEAEPPVEEEAIWAELVDGSVEELRFGFDNEWLPLEGQ